MSIINLGTGKTSPQLNIWNGTGSLAPEGPRMYKRDGYYYVLIAEGGTFTNHMVTIARSRNIHGPYEANPANPILTNAKTTRYFQAIGHADLFQDASGAWWGVALAMRLNLADLAQPMGRETVLYLVTWGEGGWPVASQVEGSMRARPLPEANGPGNYLARALRGIPISAPDYVDFFPGSTLPEHFCFWWIPDPDMYAISPPGHYGALRLQPSSVDLTSSKRGASPKSISFLGRRQVNTPSSRTVSISTSHQCTSKTKPA
jgi:beta-xylosidase